MYRKSKGFFLFLFVFINLEWIFSVYGFLEWILRYFILKLNS